MLSRPGGLLDGINTLYLADVAWWGVLIGIGIVCLGAMLWLMGLRVLGKRLETEVAIEWLPRWVSLTQLERWTILWAYVRMDKTERGIFQRLWIELDCRIYRENSFIRSAMLSAFGGSWLITEITRAIQHPDWMLGVPRPSMMPVADRPTTFIQILASDLAGKVVFAGTIFSVFCMMARIALRL